MSETDNSDLEAAAAAAAEELVATTTLGESSVVVTEPEPEDETATEEIVHRPITIEGIPDLVRNQAGQALIFGPFDDYRIVTTDFGEYACPFGMVLGFQLRDWWNDKEHRMERQPFPVYWNAEDGKPTHPSGVPIGATPTPGRRA